MRGEKQKSWIDRLKQAVSDPIGQGDDQTTAVRFIYDLGRYGARQLRQDRAPQMAAALAFRTLFGLLPVLVVGTILVRSFRGWDNFRSALLNLMDSLGMSDIHMLSTDSGPVTPLINSGQVTLSEWLLDLLQQVESINLAAIGWVGVAVLIYSAISLMITIESSFNAICRAPSGRSWSWRVPMYWFVLTLGPAAIVLTMYVDGRVGALITQFQAWDWVLTLAGKFWSLAVGWLILFAIYRLVPNRSMGARPALIGAFVAAVLLGIGKALLATYIQQAITLRHLYGSLGLIPIFMFWVYLMWLVVLFGLEVAATLHLLRGRRLEEMQSRQAEPGLTDPAVVLTVMECIAEKFSTGETVTVSDLEDATTIPETTLTIILNRLSDDGFLHRVEGSSAAYVLARTPDNIPADQLLQIGYSMVDASAPGRQSALIQRLRSAQQALAADMTLAVLTSAATTATPAPVPDSTVDQAHGSE